MVWYIGKPGIECQSSITYKCELAIAHTSCPPQSHMRMRSGRLIIGNGVLALNLLCLAILQIAQDYPTSKEKAAMLRWRINGLRFYVEVELTWSLVVKHPRDND